MSCQNTHTLHRVTDSFHWKSTESEHSTILASTTSGSYALLSQFLQFSGRPEGCRAVSRWHLSCAARARASSGRVGRGRAESGRSGSVGMYWSRRRRPSVRRRWRPRCPLMRPDGHPLFSSLQDSAVREINGEFIDLLQEKLKIDWLSEVCFIR